MDTLFRLLLVFLTPSAAWAVGTIPKDLVGTWKTTAMKCGGAEVPAKMAKEYKDPNAILFHFSPKTLESEWKSKGCSYKIFYEVAFEGPGKLRGSPTGKVACEPKGCLGASCQTTLPKLSMGYEYQLAGKKLTVNSLTGMECLTQGMRGPAEFQFQKQGKK